MSESLAYCRWQGLSRKRSLSIMNGVATHAFMNALLGSLHGFKPLGKQILKLTKLLKQL